MARSLKQHFTDWCRQQGDATYDYGDITGCAFCRFLEFNGYAKKPIVGGHRWRDRALPNGGEYHDLDLQLAKALVEYPRTFAALADRLSA